MRTAAMILKPVLNISGSMGKTGSGSGTGTVLTRKPAELLKSRRAVSDPGMILKKAVILAEQAAAGARLPEK